MALTTASFDVEDVSTWTYASVKAFVESSGGRRPEAYFLSFFGWSQGDFYEAKTYTLAEFKKHPFDALTRFPVTGPKAELRYAVQKNLINDRPDLFLNRHGPDPPSWFAPELISRAPLRGEPYSIKNVTQQFIALANNSRKHHKPKHHLEQDDQGDGDEGDNGQPLNKRQRTYKTERATPFPAITSISLPPSPPISAPGSQIDEAMKPMGLHGIQSKQRLGDRQAAVLLSQSDTPALILYITRVTIVDQQFVLERHRFGFVKYLFDQDRLVESRLQELVFGNPIHNKPTFLWFFDSTSKGQLRSITNRPSAEVAITGLKIYGERAGATGIQLFDAPDRATAALVPHDEITRKTDFAERESFETEIDDEADDEDESLEKASRVDFAYGFRDGELQSDHEMLAEEIDAKPIISIEEGPQKQQQKQKDDSDSESESGEDEDISRFYR